MLNVRHSARHSAEESIIIPTLHETQGDQVLRPKPGSLSVIYLGNLDQAVKT